MKLYEQIFDNELSLSNKKNHVSFYSYSLKESKLWVVHNRLNDIIGFKQIQKPRNVNWKDHNIFNLLYVYYVTKGIVE